VINQATDLQDAQDLTHCRDRTRPVVQRAHGEKHRARRHDTPAAAQPLTRGRLRGSGGTHLKQIGTTAGRAHAIASGPWSAATQAGDHAILLGSGTNRFFWFS
jgi:hypothetical protein